VEYLVKRFAASLLFFASLSAQTSRSVDAILADYAKAAGGLSAINAITSRKIRATTGLLEKQELYWQKPNKVLLFADKEKTGYDGSSGWVYTKRKRVRRLSQGQQMPLEINGNPLRYVNLRQLYTEIKAVPQKTVDDTVMDVLVAPNDLAQTTFYFDANTHLLARIDEKGDTSAYFTQVTWFEDYKLIDGVLFPFKITHQTTDKGGPKEEFRIKSVENNIPLDPEIFSKPQSTKLVFGGKR
jgi:outer membrane lipoprotein-sorting protein